MDAVNQKGNLQKHVSPVLGVTKPVTKCKLEYVHVHPSNGETHSYIAIPNHYNTLQYRINLR